MKRPRQAEKKKNEEAEQTRLTAANIESGDKTDDDDDESSKPV